MPGAEVDLAGLVRSEARFARAAALDFSPLMKDGEKILEDDNRRGLLAGEDCDGKPMPLTQRQQHLARVEYKHKYLKGQVKDAKAAGKELRRNNPLWKSYRYANHYERQAFDLTRKTQRHALGPMATAHLAGSGPPLIPHEEGSRAIVNVDTDSGRTNPETYEAILFWRNFTNNKGAEILPFHAYPDAKAPYPRRDIISRPRPPAVQAFRAATVDWLRGRIEGA